MPEIKNSFIQGKMNQDLDERLIPNGQYRDATNVEVATSEGSDVGTVQNILGNHRVEQLVGDGFTCVGSIANEQTNKLYWFISSYNKDVILEYDANNDIAAPVLVDMWSGTQKAVLKFFGNTITGINIIDDLLFWTDNQGEPKKINIEVCKEGTANINTHTQLGFEKNSFVGIVVDYAIEDGGSSGFDESEHPPLLQGSKRPRKGTYFTHSRRQLASMLGLDLDELVDIYGRIKDGYTPLDTSVVNVSSGAGYPFSVRHYRDGELLGIKDCVAFDNENGINTRIADSATASNDDWHLGDLLFGVNAELDLQERHITVIKQKPLLQPTVKINYTEQNDLQSKTPNLFELKFPRFSYRYKYRDGEFSAFAPFTEPVFNAQYTKDTTRSADGDILYNQDSAYDIKEPHNKAMVNAIHSVELMDFITIGTSEDVVSVDILYKQEDSPIVYSIGTISHKEYSWHVSNYEHDDLHINGAGRYAENLVSGVTRPWMPSSNGGYNSGRYLITTENIYAAMPANQILRPWDNVPRKALAQEVTGSRIVYGNYLQNYTVGSKPIVYVETGIRNSSVGSFSSKGLPSIKSQRNYQLGVIYCDAFGRETPVFTSNSGAVDIPWEDSSGNKNASKSSQLVASAVNNFPDWVDSIKFFIKETSSPYYNLAMERAWVGKSTYNRDNSEGHLWISFPSSDRNKITEDDYIILKKKIGLNEGQVSFENKFKVISIENEAPDSIKYDLVNLGVMSNTGDIMTTTGANTGEIFPVAWANSRPDKLVNNIIIDRDEWKNGSGYGSWNTELADDEDGLAAFKEKDLYLSWSRISSGGEVVTSKKYCVVGGSAQTSSYSFKLDRVISAVDADLAHLDSDHSDTTTTKLHPDLHFQIERKELKEAEDFSGQFFVKISKNQITSIVETGVESNNLTKFSVTGRQSVWYFKDDTNAGAQDHNQNPHHYGSGSPYGATNYYGDTTDHGGSQNIQNTGGGNINSTYSGGSGTARLMDYYEQWENVLGELTGSSRWFVDSVHMACGQSEVSDYAKFSCVTWAGATEGEVENLTTTFGNNKQSAWSYPPLKKWFSEFAGQSEAAAVASSGYGLFGMVNAAGGNAATSHLFDPYTEWEDEPPIDGWVGGPQTVRRKGKFITSNTTQDDTKIAKNHINSLEGMVTTNEYHTTGPRRWFSGMDGESFGNGNDTHTYSSNETEGHFMHLSFFAPGQDLHDNSWHLANPCLYGEDTWMDNLQGIWGGGVFTGPLAISTFGSDGDTANQHRHLPMEGNYAVGEVETYQVYETAPGPGSGYGYDLKHRELHERQWDPTFNSEGDVDNSIRDFIRNLYPGSRFRFNRTARGGGANALLDDQVYTVKKVALKKLYNHTTWRNARNVYYDTQDANGRYDGYKNLASHNVLLKSVEQVALEWLNAVDAVGDDSDMSSPNAAVTTYTGAKNFEIFQKKIVDFGSAHNRRCCYVIELNENPRFSNGTMGNPLNMSSGIGAAGMGADLDGGTFTDIEFLDPVQDLVLSDLSKFPAIWELSPLKQDVDLDIYYEASGNIPTRINNKTNELFAPKGCRVEVMDISSDDVNDCQLVEWNNNVAILTPGFNLLDGLSNEIDYSGIKFKFTRKDGGYTIAEAGAQQLVGANTPGLKTNFIIKPGVGEYITSGLAWYNCFSFGNGLESNRIKDDFNAMFIRNGVKASTTTQETYQQENRKHGLIFSGLYNSNSGVNDLNQFIMAENITKDLNPTYGSIQKLFSRNSDLVAFCEDKVVKILANKDAVFNADGNPQLVANQNVLGQTVPFEGQYGISKNPESFASESYRAYFTDKQRGAVLRLSKDGLTPISSTGMHDWFRDNLSNFTSLVGTYDSYKENYNITLKNTYTENIIFNTYFQLGANSEQLDVTSLSSITNGLVIGSQYSHSWETKNLDTDPIYVFDTDEIFTNTVTVTNHPAIPYAHYQAEQFGSGTSPIPILATAYDVLENYVAPDPGTPDDPDTPFAYATFDSWSSLPLNGEFTMLGFSNYSGDVWDGNTGSAANINNDIDANNLHTNIRRSHNGTVVVESSTTNARINGVGIPGYSGTFPFASGHTPDVEKPHAFGATNLYKTSQCITRTTSAVTDNDGSILFDRVGGSLSSYVEVDNIGVHPTWNNTSNNGTLNATYISNGGVGGGDHNSFYNGDELHIQVEIYLYPQWIHPQGGNVGMAMYGSAAYPFCGYQKLIPWIQILDNDAVIGSSKLVAGNLSISSGGVSSDPYTECASTPNNVGLNAVSGGNSWNGQSCILNTFSSSGGVQFPEYAMPLMGYNSPGVPLTIGCSFKFRDNSQQNTDGSFSGSGNDLVEDAKVVDNLTIRIGHNSGTGGAPFTNAAFKLGQSNYPLKNPLWEIRDINAVKGYGVLTPHSDFVQGAAGDPADPGYAGDWVTYYDDPGTTTVEAYTAGDITSSGGAWDAGLGAYVLNYDAIQGYVTSPLGGAYYQPPIPAVAVPGFVEIQHSQNNWTSNVYSSAFAQGTNYGQWNQTREASAFGVNRSKGTIVTANYTEPSTGGPTGSQVSWYEGVDPGTGAGTGQENQYGNTGDYFSKSITNNINGTINYTVPQGITGGAGGSGTTPSSVVFSGVQSDYWRFKGGVGTTGGYGFATDILNADTWTAGWYLTDIELDEWEHPEIISFNSGVNPTIATGGTNGMVCIRGVVDATGSISMQDDLALYGGVGQAVGANSQSHAMLTWHWREKYGDQRWVLRAIFQVGAGSHELGVDELRIRIYGMESEIHFYKVISKRIDYTNGTGTATNWLRGNVTGGTDEHAEHQYHTLSQQKVYLHDNMLCYDMVDTENNYLAATSTGNESWWKSNFESGKAPEDVGEGWIYKFSIYENPKTNDPVSGVLGCIVTNNKGVQSYNASADEITGAHIMGVTQEGQYEVGFDMSGTLTSPNWYVNRNSAPDTTGVHLEVFGSTWSNTNPNSANCVGWYNGGGSMVSKLSFGINDMILTNQSTVFSGGLAGSWDFDGFDSTSNQYITWDRYWDPNGAADGRIQFNFCPNVDPTFGNGNVMMMASQYIDKVINRYEKYEISFNFRMQTQDDNSNYIDGQGLFHMYYFNAAGYGFRINDIGDEDFATLAAPNYTKEAIYDQSMIDAGSTLEDAFLWWRVTKIVGIGDGSIYDPATGNGNIISTYGTTVPGVWENAYSEFQTQGIEAFRDTLVIRKDSSEAQDVTGWIDDISMRLVYEVPLGTDGYSVDRPKTTVSFSESVKGWTSFKSFIPESGLSLSKKYFTLSDGKLHQHYYPLKWSGTEYLPCELLHADNYNRFYNYLGEDAFGGSSIQAVLNAEPSAVKTFNTINYEGSQAYIPIPTTLDQVSGYNSQAWLNGANIDGWRCVDITTDLDVGHVNNFIKKEGKWFGYIKGKATTTLNTSLFSVQGLGVVESTTEYTSNN